MDVSGLWNRSKAAAHATGATARRVGRAVRRTTFASGAGRTGLGHLIELSALNSAGDAVVAVALAGTLFFGVPVDQARGRVALYLLVTMAPFAVVAPLVGPALDRMRSARRYAIASTMLARGLLCWAMAGAVLHHDAVTLFPSAFGALVLSKAYGVSRAAVTPRMLPAEITLVTANARATLAGLIAAAVVAPVVAGLNVLIGPDWVLRLGMVVFLAGTVLGLRLPRHVDDPEDGDAAAGGDVADAAATDGTPEEPGRRRGGRHWRTLLNVGPVVAEAMWAGGALRAFSGFMVLFLAFLLRTHRLDGMSPNVALGVLAAAAGAGGLAGTAVGAWARTRLPHVVVFGMLALATAATVVCAVFFGLVAVVVAAFVAALCQSLGKLGLDATIQREIGEEIRSSTFAVSEALNQLAWVLGGLIGLGLSLAAGGRVGLAIAGGALGIALVVLLVGRFRRLRAARAAARSTPAGAASN